MQQRERARERGVCVCVCVYFQGGKGSKVFASRVLVVGQLVMYLTGYSDYLTCFRELFLTIYQCYTGFKNVKQDHWLQTRVYTL